MSYKTELNNNYFSVDYFKAELKMKLIEKDLSAIEKICNSSLRKLPLFLPLSNSTKTYKELTAYLKHAKENIRQLIRGLSIEQLDLLDAKNNLIFNNCFKKEVQTAKQRYVEQRLFLNLMSNERHSYPG